MTTKGILIVEEAVQDKAGRGIANGSGWDGSLPRIATHHPGPMLAGLSDIFPSL